MGISGMNHFNILTDDVDATVHFYCDLLGLRNGPRPDFNFPGAWLYQGDAPILHVSGGRTRADLKPGVIDHMAFSAKDLKGTLQRLEAAGFHGVCQKQIMTGIWQVFVNDPNGARVELDFAPDEATP